MPCPTVEDTFAVLFGGEAKTVNADAVGGESQNLVTLFSVVINKILVVLQKSD